MQRKAHGAQRLRHTALVGEGASTVQRSDAPEKRIDGSFRHAASFEMSATWFINPPNCCSSAARLVRTALSSAITIT